MKSFSFQKFKIKPLSLFWAFIILLLSLLSFQNIEKEKLELIPHLDKLAHLSMYFILSFLMSIDYFKKTKKKIMSIFIPAAISILYSGILELLQYFSTYRSVDIYDFLFNCIGSVMGVILFLLLYKMKNET